MNRDPLALIKAYLEGGPSAIYQGEKAPPAPRPIVTIARDHGAGGEEIGQTLADKLGVKYLDKEILDRVVQAAHNDPVLMRSLDERVKDKVGTFLYASLRGLEDPHLAYRECLIKTVLGLSGLGGVFMGRGANVILRDRPIFRLRIAGSPKVCARRLAAGGPAAEPQAARDAETVNAERAAFIWEVFGVRANDPLNYDLTVNTDHYPDLAKVAEFVLAAQRAHHWSRVNAGA